MNGEAIVALAVVVLAIGITFWLSELRWRQSKKHKKHALGLKNNQGRQEQIPARTTSCQSETGPKNKNEEMENSMKDFLANITERSYHGYYIAESVAVALVKLRKTIGAEETDPEKKREKMHIAYSAAIMILGSIYEITSSQEEILIMGLLNNIINPKK